MYVNKIVLLIIVMILSSTILMVVDAQENKLTIDQFEGYTTYTSKDYSWKYVVSFFPDGLIESVEAFSYVPNTHKENLRYKLLVIKKKQVLLANGYIHQIRCQNTQSILLIIIR